MLQLRELTAQDLIAGIATTPGPPTSGRRVLGHPLPAEPCKGHDPIVLEDGRDLLCGRDIDDARSQSL